MLGFKTNPDLYFIEKNKYKIFVYYSLLQPEILSSAVIALNFQAKNLVLRLEYCYL